MSSPFYFHPIIWCPFNSISWPLDHLQKLPLKMPNDSKNTPCLVLLFSSNHMTLVHYCLCNEYEGKMRLVKPVVYLRSSYKRSKAASHETRFPKCGLEAKSFNITQRPVRSKNSQALCRPAEPEPRVMSSVHVFTSPQVTPCTLGWEILMLQRAERLACKPGGLILILVLPLISQDGCHLASVGFSLLIRQWGNRWLPQPICPLKCDNSIRPKSEKKIHSISIFLFHQKETKVLHQLVSWVIFHNFK